MPIPPHQTSADREDALRHAFRGVELDAERERVIAWVALQRADIVATLVTLIECVRSAGVATQIMIEDALRRQDAESANHGPGYVADFVPGNSGPGWP